jgi:WD40 repeat protein/serine/threonine protein kinase
MEPDSPPPEINKPLGGSVAEGLFALAAEGTPEPNFPEKAGERIGPYKLREQIGEGGFGSVWVADQETPIQRRVALKIIKLGMDTKDVVARFEQERQALALMDHPNIAKVLDAGATQWGRPYFVMELVRGIKLTDYCDQANLTTAERLGLFMQVCRAVQHAHQKGIIHRDLKPSNILVTLHDGVPVPKVIDFGIAKATQGRLTDKTIYTQFKQMIGTPSYMSPEQAELSGLDVDTRSDIYSLGVLLYELLVGRTPFDLETLMKAGLDEMRRVIREEEPPKPSTVLQTMTAEMRTTVASRRQVEGTKIEGLVRGDLDWIVMKALEKDRTRRYETVNGFAEDIRRYLKNEPVTAAAPSAGYRFRKFARRHKAVFVTVSAVALALIAGIAVSSWQAVRANREAGRATRAERVAGEERTLALKERNRAREAEQVAKDQRQLAETARLEAEQNFYAASMGLAQRAWELTDMAGLRRILEETRNYPDRGFEWHYLQRLAHLELRALRGHEGKITSVAISSNGRRLVTGSEDHTAKVWDAETGRLLLTVTGHTKSTGAVAIFPDGRRIVTSSEDATAKVWDMETGRELLTLKAPARLIESLAISPDGRRIVTGCADKTARVWDAETGRELLTLKGHANSWIYAIAFSSDGRRIVTGSADETAKVWDAVTGHELLTLTGHSAWVRSVAFSPDGLRIVSGGDDKMAKVWDAETGRELLTLKGHTGTVSSVAFSHDGQRIVTGSADKMAKVWEAGSGRNLLTFKGHNSGVNAVAIFPDGRRIVTGSSDNTAKLWDAKSDRELLTLKGHIKRVSSVAFSPNGQRIATGSWDNTAKLWNAETGLELCSLRGHGEGQWVAFSELMIKESVYSVAFDRDGRRVVTGAHDGTAKVWDAETGRELLTLNQRVIRGNFNMALQSVAFSPDGRRIVTGSLDGMAKVWDADTGRLLLTLSGFGSGVTSVAFSPDGEKIAAGRRDKTAKVWDAATGRDLLTLKGHRAPVFSVAFSPDSRRIVTGSSDHMAKVWDTETGSELLSLNGHFGLVNSATFSPDGRRVLTGSFDGTAKVWDAKNGFELLTLKGHGAEVSAAAFSPDGRRILTGSWDETAKVWMAASTEEVEAWRKEERSAGK